MDIHLGSCPYMDSNRDHCYIVQNSHLYSLTRIFKSMRLMSVFVKCQFLTIFWQTKILKIAHFTTAYGITILNSELDSCWHSSKHFANVISADSWHRVTFGSLSGFVQVSSHAQLVQLTHPNGQSALGCCGPHEHLNIKKKQKKFD